MQDFWEADEDTDEDEDYSDSEEEEDDNNDDLNYVEEENRILGQFIDDDLNNSNNDNW